MAKLAEQVREATNGIVTEMGFELADVEFIEERENGWVLTLYIWRPEGVNVDDCEAVSRAVEPIVDEIDPTEAAYFLSVSSLGLERAFKTTRDFERYIGKPVELRFYVAPKWEDWQEGEQGEATKAAKNEKKNKKNKKNPKERVGTLVAAVEDSVLLESDGQQYRVPREAVALARPYIEF